MNKDEELKGKLDRQRKKKILLLADDL